MKHIVAAITIGVALMAPGLGSAREHTGLQPSQYCDGSTPSSPPAKIAGDRQPGVCFQLGGGFKGAVWYDPDTHSVVVDGDQSNGNSSRCLDGYAGVEARDGTDAQILWSQGGNYDPTADESDGGTHGYDPGSAHDPFDPATEAGEVPGCVAG